MLLDFGAARESLGRKSSNVTAFGLARFSPPGSTKAWRAGAWTDIYALSDVLSANHGRAPVDAAQRMNRLLRGEPDPLPDLADGAGNGYRQRCSRRGSRPPAEAHGAYQTLDAWLAQIQATDDPAPHPSRTGADRGAPPVAEGRMDWRGGRQPWRCWGPPCGSGSAVVGGVDSPVELGSDAGEPAPITPDDDVAAPTEDPPPASAPAAMLFVETTPPGVEVLLADAPLGETPLEIGELRPGVYALTLRHPHYRTVRLADQKLADGEVLRVERTMVRDTGKLTVLTEPRNAWIEHDGERLARGTPVTLEDLPAGIVTLHVGADGYRNESFQVEVMNDSVGRLEGRPWNAYPRAR